jgi:hypothetical protein
MWTYRTVRRLIGHGFGERFEEFVSGVFEERPHLPRMVCLPPLGNLALKPGELRLRRPRLHG